MVVDDYKKTLYSEYKGSCMYELILDLCKSPKDDVSVWGEYFSTKLPP